MVEDKTTGRLRWASQRHPKGRPRKNTALSVFRRFSRASDPRPHSGDQSSSADLEHTGQNFGGTAPDPNLPSAAGAGKGAAENAGGEESTTETRRIYFNMRLPEEETHDDGTPIHHYPRNKIRTAKYTPLTFIPKNLFLQFHNVANIYFTFIVILQVTPAPSPSVGIDVVDIPHLWRIKSWSWSSSNYCNSHRHSI
jgi:phospholipid-translocating ATPase